MGTFCLITGASGGIGREFARVFAKNGHDLILVARSRDKLDALCGELKTVYGRSVPGANFKKNANMGKLIRVNGIKDAVARCLEKRLRHNETCGYFRKKGSGVEWQMSLGQRCLKKDRFRKL